MWPLNYKIIMMDASGDGWNEGGMLRISTHMKSDSYSIVEGDSYGGLETECFDLLEQYPNSD